MFTREEKADQSWRLQGYPLQVALFTGVAFFAGSVLAAAVDLYSHGGWDSPTLQAWTLVPQTLACAGLFLIGWRKKSVSFYILAALIGLIIVEEAFHVLNPVAAWFGRVGTWVLVYGLVAAVGLAGLVLSHWHGTAGERRVVRNIAILLLAGGFFGGPIATVSSIAPARHWLFIEEFGEAAVFAAMAGYVSGLVMHLGDGVTSRPLRPTRL